MAQRVGRGQVGARQFTGNFVDRIQGGCGRAWPGRERMFSAQMRAHRQRRGLTQEELAARTGVSVRSIRNLESGRITRPRPGTVRLLADAFALDGADRERFCESALDDAAPPTATARRSTPAQLPADVAGFVGRGDHLRRLTELLDGGDRPAAVVISAIAGTAGVGKTALAVHWAHRVRDRFPDGQLYVNLRGYDPDRPTSPGEVLTRFLNALGVAEPEVPAGPDELAARYRTEVAGRRLLIVLDNAATVEQVRPLLPGTNSCAVLVTSRDSLAGLVAVDGGQRLDLDLLPRADAVGLLRRLIGDRVDADTGAAAALAALCADLPLALRVAAELAAARATAPLAELVAELADQQQRLELLDVDGDPRASLTAVFSWSIRNLPPDVARLFRLLGLHPGPDFDAYAVAALADVGLAPARRALDRLARAHLVHHTGPGRYGMHDLLRAYATGLATAEGSEVDRRGPRAGCSTTTCPVPRRPPWLCSWRAAIPAPTCRNPLPPRRPSPTRRPPNAGWTPSGSA
jgi:transcriptional regulator with XRE-family HTH domain